jgi:hypothetical protein
MSDRRGPIGQLSAKSGHYADPQSQAASARQS